MDNDETLCQALTAQFNVLSGIAKVQKIRRIMADAPVEQFRAIFEYAVKTLDFSHLCTITGLDEGDSIACIYHVAHPQGTVLSLKTRMPKTNPVFRSITDLFPGGAIYEREIVDLLGARFEGLPEGKRYPLPDTWPANQHPLRKDWKIEMLDQTQYPKGEETKHE